MLLIPPNLTDLGKGQVYLAAQRLKEKTDLTVVIEGHADSRGNEEYNQKLGLQRAQTVMNELAAQGIDRNRMSTASVGESQTVDRSRYRTWARAVNRRVEFQVKARALDQVHRFFPRPSLIFRLGFFFACG